MNHNSIFLPVADKLMSFSDNSHAILITDLNPADVVLGRGAGPNEHSGNVAFREIVHEFKPSYMATVNRKAKSQIARKVVQAIKARRGRFLKRAPNHDDDVFVLAKDEVVMEKAKQALRHGRCTVKPRKKTSRIASTDSLQSATSALSTTDLWGNQASIVSPFGSRNALMEGSSGPPASAEGSPAIANDLLFLALLAQQRKFNAASMAENTTSSPPNSSQCNMTASTPPDNDASRYQVLLQTLMGLAEDRRQKESNEFLQSLELMQLLTAAKKARAEAPVTTVIPPNGSVVLPEIETTTTTAASSMILLAQLLQAQQQQSQLQGFAYTHQVPFPSHSPAIPEAKCSPSFNGLNANLLDAALLNHLLSPHG
ncbi:hypothetical protein IV203_033081 [Nitzschia inconspicua]|uniref:DUF6824 domain-containing protein n=1 Tax=Nitzschia inconspicua TaxID=303405 RepID=A0A9K3PFP4_9STRA|nr:hypothetical protein IV203_033081 [Nitzschia inconspicua]